MPNPEPNRWSEQLRGATQHIEDDLKRLVTYINDEVVPEIRRDGSKALRTAASELEKLARRMEERRAPARDEPPRP